MVVAYSAVEMLQTSGLVTIDLLDGGYKPSLADSVVWV